MYLSKSAIKAFANESHAYQMDVTIDLFASSYINFYVGWRQQDVITSLNPTFITYEQLIDDEEALILSIAKSLNLRVSKDTINKVSTKISNAGGINLSTGITGRGKDLFTREQIDTLRSKARILGCDHSDFLGFEA